MRAFWLRVSTPKDASKYFAFSIALAGNSHIRLSGITLASKLLKHSYLSKFILVQYFANILKIRQKHTSKTRFFSVIQDIFVYQVDFSQ